MANLKMGTLLGGNMIWHTGNMPLDASDSKLLFRDYEVYHEGHKPTPAEVGAVAKTGDTMTGRLMIDASSSAGAQLIVRGDVNTATGSMIRFDEDDINGGFIKYEANANQIQIGGRDGNTDRVAISFHRGNGNVLIAGVPTTGVSQGSGINALTRKDYVDSRDNLKVNKAGDTMTGILATTSSFKSNKTSSASNVLMGSYEGFDDLLGWNDNNGSTYGGAYIGKRNYHLRTGNENSEPTIHRGGGTAYKLYHEGHKPTPAEIGAVNKAGDTMTGALTLKAGQGGGINLNHGNTLESVGDYEVAFRNTKEIRFGDSNEWSFGDWGGIGYDSSTQKLYIGNHKGDWFSASGSEGTCVVQLDGAHTLQLGQAVSGDKLNNSRGWFVEKVSDTGGETAARMMFTEHNNTADGQYKYGVSLGYDGIGSSSSVFPSGAKNNLGDSGWALKRHDNNIDGVSVMYGTRGSNDVKFSGTLYAQNNKQVYHEGHKPTPDEIGAQIAGQQTINVVQYTGGGTPDYILITSNDGYTGANMPMIEIHGRALFDLGYTSPMTLKIGNYGYGGDIHNPQALLIARHKVTAKLYIVNNGGKRAYAVPGGYCPALTVQLHNSIGTYGSNPKGWTVTEKTDEEILAMTKVECPMDQVYGTGFKPTPAEVGAVNKAGDTMTGSLVVDEYRSQFGNSANGSYGNGSILGQLNDYIEIVSPDAGADTTAGLVFHGRGEFTSSIGYYKNGNTFDFKSDQSGFKVKVNGNEVYHEGHKPTFDEIGHTYHSFNATGTGSSQGFEFNGKTAIGGTNDGWLRLNPHNQFSSGIFCGSSGVRTDAASGFQRGSWGSNTSGTMRAASDVGWAANGNAAFSYVQTNSSGKAHWLAASYKDGTNIRSGIQVLSTDAGNMRFYTNLRSKYVEIVDGCLTAPYTISAKDFCLKTTSDDTGDIVWYNKSSEEVGRLWIGGTAKTEDSLTWRCAGSSPARKIYHEGHKPTPAEIGALPASGKAIDSAKADYITAWDDRDVKPNTTGISDTKGVKAFFAATSTFPSGIGGSYTDLLVVDTYSDSSGGSMNALAFGKTSNALYHIQSGFDAATWGTPRKIYTTAQKPTPAEIGALPASGKAVDSSKLNGAAETTSPTANTIAKRDGSADIQARLFRSNYGNETRITGAMAFRVSNSDNYIRFCSSSSAIRTWLDVYSKGDVYTRSQAQKKITYGTGNPSGGSTGDVYIQYK